MSKEDADKFVDKAKKDPSIQKALHERSKHPVDIGREHNLHFTEDELKKARSERDVVESDQATWCTAS